MQFLKGYLNAVGLDITTKIIASDNLTSIIGEGNFDMFEWGWVVEPDPNYQLSTFTCANRSYKDGDSILANLSDSFYCNQAYDDLYAKQGVETDEAKRVALSNRMEDLMEQSGGFIFIAFEPYVAIHHSDIVPVILADGHPNPTMFKRA